mgnify:CR=1 FL=1
MQCKKCGAQYEGNFCPQCGTPAEEKMRVCPVCGKERGEDERFCKGCGYDFGRETPAESAEAETPAAAAAVQPQEPAAEAALVHEPAAETARPQEPVVVASVQPQKSVAAAVRRPFLKAEVVRGIAVVAAVAVFFAILILTLLCLSNKFRIDVVEKISLGDSRKQVIDVLGKPYDYVKDSFVFQYYSDNYRKLLEKNDSFDPDDIQDWEDFGDAFDEALELEQKLQTEEYQYISVTFDSDGGVSSVFLDTARCEENSGKKALKSYSLLNETVYAYAETELFYTAEYTDGSYYMGKTPDSVNATEVGNLMVQWKDRYGNECSYPVTVVTNPEIPSGWYYDEQEKVLHILSDDAYDEDFPEDIVAVEFGSNVTKIDSYAFSGYSGLTSITIPDSVTSIGRYAFSGCSGLTSITIPDSVTSIGMRAFNGCSNLISITIGNGVALIGERAFYDCTSLKSVYINDLAAWCAIDFGPGYRQTNPLLNAGHLYLNGNLVTDLIIPNGVTSIASYAFQSCSSLTSITIPDSVTSIGYKAFYNCDSLTNVVIGDGVTSIGEEAFNYCDSLTSITIGDGVTSIEYRAFFDCDNIESATMPTLAINSIPQDNLKTVVLTSGTSIGSGAFEDCRKLARITIPDSVISIGNSAFEGCTSLASITIPNSVTSIGDEAFYECTNLKNVIIGDGVTSIGDRAFSGCSGLTSIIIPDGVTSIGDRAFSGCSGLTSIIIPDGVTSIGSSAFSGCDSLTSVTIGNGVTSIGRDAFANCDSLTSVIFENQNGWSTNGEALSAEDLADPATAAEYLTDTYLGGIWTRE